MLDYILNIFVSTDKYRKNLHRPHLSENGFVYASNGNIAIKIPYEKLLLPYKSVEKFPNAEHILQEAKDSAAKKITIDTERLSRELAKCRMELEKKDCNICNGVGEKKCDECGSMYTCNECDGTGKIDKTFPLVKFAQISNDDDEPRAGIRIGDDLTFHPDMINRIFLTALALNKQIITFQYHEKTKACFISFDDIEIIIMPMYLK